MEILTVPIPLQPFVDRFIGTALTERLADPETTHRWLVAPSLIIESADPASAQIIITVTPEHPVHLIDQLCCPRRRQSKDTSSDFLQTKISRFA
jgi:hypothetical protein